jgi:hypothetical protein
MRKFIFSIIAFSFLIVSIYILISYSVKPKAIINNNFLAAIIDKHNRIDQLHCPKIIFAGGSNIAFGLNSEEVEKEFSVPVVNLGLHAGLGLSFILNELKKTIRNDDVVFLSIEYFLDSDGDFALKKKASDIYQQAGKYYINDIRSRILMNLDNTRKNIKRDKENNKVVIDSNKEIQIYSRKAFNKYGDVIAHLEKIPPTELINMEGAFTYRYWTGINELNEFYNYAKSKNVAVFFIYPNLSETKFNKSKDAINKLSVDLSNNLEIEILNKPSDFVFSDSLFFDTVYHLNKKGREIRTKRLIEIIKKNTNAQQKINAIRVSL